MSSTDDIAVVQDIPTLADLYSSSEIQDIDDQPTHKYDPALNKRISIWRGNIVKLKSDMIVNAANKSLLGGGGVDGAIHRAAGKDLLRECETLGGAQTGETKVTKAYKLPSSYVAHTVGPVYAKTKVDQSRAKLESCYRTSLELCDQFGGGSIGFSSISTGIYGYPIVDATHVALETTRKFLEQNQSVSRVIYVVFSAKDEQVYRDVVSTYFPPPTTETAEPTAPPKATEESDHAEPEAKKAKNEEDEDEYVLVDSQATAVGPEEEKSPGADQEKTA